LFCHNQIVPSLFGSALTGGKSLDDSKKDNRLLEPD
jgi:hypothetical protein